MAGWKRTVISVATSLGLGAAVAAWRERRRRRLLTLRAAQEAAVVVPPADATAPSVGDDPLAALDAARERLRAEAQRARDEGGGAAEA